MNRFEIKVTYTFDNHTLTDTYPVLPNENFGKPGPMRKARWYIPGINGTNIFFRSKKTVINFFNDDNSKAEIIK